MYHTKRLIIRVVCIIDFLGIRNTQYYNIQSLYPQLCDIRKKLRHKQIVYKKNCQYKKKYFKI